MATEELIQCTYLTSATGGAFIEEPARRTPIRRTTDVLVIGAGASGLMAAVAAARLGMRVLLVDRNGYLGGTLTMVTLGSFCGLYAVTPDAIHPIVQGLAQDFFDRMRVSGALRPPQRWLQTASQPYDPASLKLVADGFATDAGVSLAFHNVAVGVLNHEHGIAGVIFEGRDGRWACRAQVVVDCSGDGDVSAFCGAAFDLDLDAIQAPTTMFQFGGVDVDRAHQVGRAQMHECLERAVAAGIDLPRTAGGAFSIHPDSMHLNITKVRFGDRTPNPLDTADLTAAEIEGRRQLARYLEAFRQFVPGYEHSYVRDIGASIGVRESRRILGDYQLSAKDVLNQGRFDDAIACGAWPMEKHARGRSTEWVFLDPGTYYQMPYRMLLPHGIDGLLVAGRCASAEHDAHASMRVAGICMALGEAAGTAAALAVQANVTPRALNIDALQHQLARQGAYLGDGPLPPPLSPSSTE